MEIITGAVTTEDNFFEGRRDALNDLREQLKVDDVLVLGPRRTGKTSLIKQLLLEDNKTTGRKYLYMSLEDTKGLYQFYLRIIRELLHLTSKYKLIANDSGEFLKESCNFLSKTFQGKISFNPGALTSEIEAGIDITIPTFDPVTIDALQQKLAKILESLTEPITIVLDEFPDIIFKFNKEERQEKSKHLLSGLRAVRQRTNFNDEKNHRVIIAGSINLESTLSSLGLADTINDLPPLKIPNLLPSQSADLLESLGKHSDFNFEMDIRNYVIKYFNYCTPYYIQLFAAYLKEIKRAKKVDQFTQEHCDDAYKKLIVGQRGPNYFLKRLKNPEYYEPSHQKPIREILALIAKNQDLENRSTSDDELKTIIPDNLDRNELISQIYSDDFIQVMEGGLYKFECQLIFNYWNFFLNGASYKK